MCLVDVKGRFEVRRRWSQVKPTTKYLLGTRGRSEVEQDVGVTK